MAGTPKGSRPKAGYLETPARNPVQHSSNVTAYVSLDKVNRYLTYGPAHKFYEAMYCVRATLGDPHVVLRYNEDEWQGYCYVRAEPSRYTNGGAQVPVADGFVFLVFVTDDMKVIEWGFEPANRDDIDLPMNDREGNMREVIWRR